MKEKAYYETINVKNEVKLRKLLEHCHPFANSFLLALKQQALPGQKLHTHMISGVSLITCMLPIRSVLKWILQIFQSLF